MSNPSGKEEMSMKKPYVIEKVEVGTVDNLFYLCMKVKDTKGIRL